MDNKEFLSTVIAVILFLVLLWYWFCPDQTKVIYHVENLEQPNLAQKFRLDPELGGIPVNALSVTTHPKPQNNKIILDNSMTSLQRMLKDQVTIPFGDEVNESMSDYSSSHIHRHNKRLDSFNPKKSTGPTSSRMKQLNSVERNNLST